MEKRREYKKRERQAGEALQGSSLGNRGMSIKRGAQMCGVSKNLMGLRACGASKDVYGSQRLSKPCRREGLRW